MSGRKSTPTPWRRDGTQVSPAPVKGMEVCAYLVGGRDGSHPTIFVSSYVRTKKERDQFEANVELILKAVNGAR